MKVFDLTCDHGHRFEGWFASSERFDAQREAGDVRCPLCDSATVVRAPSAPRLNLHGGDAAPRNDPKAVAPDVAVAASAMFDRLRRAIADSDNVGARFAEEARRIHYAEVPPRAIRGTATDQERHALRDEGIETLSFPAVPALTETLQ